MTHIINSALLRGPRCRSWTGRAERHAPALFRMTAWSPRGHALWANRY